MPATLSASEAAIMIRTGKLTSVDLVQHYIDRIAKLENTIRAWSFFDPAYALEQARDADRRRLAKAPLGALHGIPVGIKDIFDTRDMPTENGTVLHGLVRRACGLGRVASPVRYQPSPGPACFSTILMVLQRIFHVLAVRLQNVAVASVGMPAFPADVMRRTVGDAGVLTGVPNGRQRVRGAIQRALPEPDATGA